MSELDHDFHLFKAADFDYYPEVVLSLLIESFTFSVSIRDIFWSMCLIQTPILKDSPESQPQLPLRVALLDPI